MRLKPRNGWVIGRVAITKPSSAIITPDVTKNVTKFALVEALSPEAAAAGYKVGDLLMCKQMHNIFLRGGKYHRVTFPIDEIVCSVDDVPLSEFVDSAGNPMVAEEAAA